MVGGSEDGRRSTGPEADGAIAAALAITGGGRATAVEHDGELGATWEVEVLRADGITVDVRLAADYGVVRITRDAERPARRRATS